MAGGFTQLVVWVHLASCPAVGGGNRQRSVNDPVKESALLLGTVLGTLASAIRKATGQGNGRLVARYGARWV